MPGKKLLQDKLLIIVGPTSSGKSELAVQLAKRYNGEVVSCDSRQIYKGMDLGTGKVPGHWAVGKMRGRAFYQHYVYRGIAHHLIDFVNPKQQYTIALFKDQAQKTIADIIKRGKLPILCGGTAHWIDAVIFNLPIPDVKPNPKLRTRLEKKSADRLFEQLKKLDAHRAANIDPKNKRRLIRALEIVLSTGKSVPIFKFLNLKSLNYKTLWLGLNLPKANLYKRIDARLKQRLKAGMIKEVKKLKNLSLSWKKLETFGLEYKYVSLFLQKKISYDEMFKQLSYAIKHYAKRQLTWWKRNKEIKWITRKKQANNLVEKFLN